MSVDLQFAATLWHPIASSTDLPYRHVFHGQLLGRELAVWRADDGHVNTWENRCLHRGVRLSIGINDGSELICQYHGWRYANRTAGCTYIPAHPADSPARTICNNHYPVAERYGMIWSSVEPATPEPQLNVPDGDCLALRPIPVNASLSRVVDALRTVLITDPVSGATVIDGLDVSGEFALSSAPHTIGVPQLQFILQPVDSGETVIRGVLCGSLDQPQHWLRSINHTLSMLRDKIEILQAQDQLPEPWQAPIRPVPEALAAMPALAQQNSDSQRVIVSEIKDAANIRELTLTPVSDGLVTWQPGAHIDVQLPNGLKRQYSLINAPGETDRYRIAVKRDENSRGGSTCIHQTLKKTDQLIVSSPRNNFPLRRDALKTLFIAGGIGITPVLAMAQALAHSGADYELHHFVRSETAMPFEPVLQALGCQQYIGHSAEQTMDVLVALLAEYQPAHHVVICGPQPMLDSARQIAATNGWPDDAVHFEYFANPNHIDDSSAFEVSLARSGLTATVPAGTTLLQALRDHGVQIASSCEQGACGTCIVDVIDGQPLHQDVYLSDAERAQGNCMLTCVSRAISNSLTLDI